jgi:hypothetical protein
MTLREILMNRRNTIRRMRQAVLALLVAVSTTMSAQQQSPDLRTRAETSNYEETSSYDDVMRIVRAVVAGSALAKYETYGKTEEGREMPLLILSEPAVATPEAAHTRGRPIVFIQGNIHAGEVEGKEASLILARRLTQGDLRPLLKQLVILITPIYNADGNERVNVMNRTAQYGPVAGVGTRENSQGLDLNRDHMKLDSLEARAFVGLLNRWDPHVSLDLHTTNGSYHGFHLTYSPSLNPDTDPRLVALARERILPAMQQAVLKKHSFRTYYYGNFASEAGIARETSRVDPANPGDTIWRTFDHRPRFNNNYVGLRNRLAILSEAYSYLDFRGRVRVTEVFVEEALNAVIANASRITTLTAQLDADTKGYANGSAPLPLGVDFRLAALPSPVEILVGDVEKKLNPRSGREMLVMSETAVPVKMKDYGVFESTRTVTMPRGWLIPRAHVESAAYTAAFDRLRMHGVRVQRVTAPSEIAVQRFVIEAYTRAPKPFQNRYEARLIGKHEAAKLSAEEGSLFIPANQPLARLAFYLLEPESDDGLVTWNLIETGLAPGATYPIYRVIDGSLKVAP